MKKALHLSLGMILALGTVGMAFSSSPDQTAGNANTRLDQRVANEVRHELVMTPQFTVFDNLTCSVNGGT